MNVRDAQKLRDTLLIVGFLIMLAAYVFEPLIYVGAAVCFSCFIPHFLFNKCPHCGKQLGKNEGSFCHHCGGEIDSSV